MPLDRAGAGGTQLQTPATGKYLEPQRTGHAFDLLRDSLGYALKRAQVRTYDLLFSILGKNALSPGRLTALSFIGSEPGISQSTLAERLQISRTSVVKVVDSLETLALVERQSVDGDRRSYSLALTGYGRAELQKLDRKVREYEQKIAERLSGAERQLLISLLEKVATPSVETPSIDK